jgi:hypothetical protein
MVEGGRWVWQVDKLQRAPGRPWFNLQRRSFPPNPPQPPHLVQQQQNQRRHNEDEPTEQVMKQQQKKPTVQGRKEHDKPDAPPSAMSVIDLRYRSLTCYNCGEPNHFVGICTRAKVCFICSDTGHYMTECPNWKKPQPIATYVGSARPSLRFYHIDLLKC